MAHTIDELREKQSLPLDIKIQLTIARVRAWVNEFGEDGCYISFSGGKDSTVLMDIVRNRMGYNIPAMFVNVPTQFPELKTFALTWDNVDVMNPKISFMEVCDKYGFPLISKETADCVQGARKYLKNISSQVESLQTTKRSEQKCIYCDNLLGKKGCLGMCNKHYIQYKRWGDPLHADNKERATIDGYYRDGKTGRREHRVIYEEHYGIKLTEEEIIHHINFVKTDNRIENLYKYPNASEHIKAHREYERLYDNLKDNEEIYFDNGKYMIRERESTSRQTGLSLLLRQINGSREISEDGDYP